MGSENIVVPLIFWLFFYTLFSILYAVVQKLSKKEIKLKTIRNGGAITTISLIIILSVFEEPPPGEMVPFFVLWGLVIFGIIKFFEDKKKVTTKVSKDYENAILFGTGIGLSPLIGFLLLSIGIYHEIAIFPILISATAGLFLTRRLFIISAIIGTLLILLLFRTGQLGYVIDVNPIILLVILGLPGLISNMSAEKIRRKEFQWNLLYIILGFLPAYVFILKYFGGYAPLSVSTILLTLIIGAIGAYYKTEKSPPEERPKVVEKKEEKREAKPQEKPTIEPKPAPPKLEQPVEKPEPEEEKPKVQEVEPKPEKKIEKEPPKTSGPMRSCPYCKGKLSELNFYKLKSGNDVSCEYCGEIISC